MKMKDVLQILNKKDHGFMVSFEWCGDGFLRGDHFPDKHAGEDLIENEFDAWELARKFAMATKGRTCNLYVIKSDFVPVPGYMDKIILNR